MALPIDVQSLVTASVPYDAIPQGYREAVEIYLLAQKAGLGGLTINQLVQNATQYDAIPEGYRKAVIIWLLAQLVG
jgi:hypothetical protein